MPFMDGFVHGTAKLSGFSPLFEVSVAFNLSLVVLKYFGKINSDRASIFVAKFSVPIRGKLHESKNVNLAKFNCQVESISSDVQGIIKHINVSTLFGCLLSVGLALSFLLYAGFYPDYQVTNQRMAWYLVVVLMPIPFYGLVNWAGGWIVYCILYWRCHGYVKMAEIVEKSADEGVDRLDEAIKEKRVGVKEDAIEFKWT